MDAIGVDAWQALLAVWTEDDSLPCYHSTEKYSTDVLEALTQLTTQLRERLAQGKVPASEVVPALIEGSRRLHAVITKLRCNTLSRSQTRSSGRREQRPARSL